MAIHQKLGGLSVEAIDEYVKASELCLDFRKVDGGCLGYPATLLLFCVVDAIGRYLALEKRNNIPKGQPFFVLNHPCVGLTLTPEQIKRLKRWYRNGLAHNAALPPGTCLTGDDGPPFDFAANGDPVMIRVFSFHRLVAQAWEGLDKGLIVPSKVMDTRKMPTVGFPASGLTGSVIAASGCLVPATIQKL
ncbi:hypothetical protein SBA4_3510003 [Candidatus Sulfopaludibacter sp. SbA4]|nr:hypothetical protein SBA4_3510003 [Candidatus Sulfopaludibacter sp. SbA4]